MKPEIITGDLLDQNVDVIVNPWNRNFIPWWLLLPHGVSKAIKKRAGYAPFKEVSKHGIIPTGGAVLTSAGRLPHKAIIHVAGINAFWCATKNSVRLSARNALSLAQKSGFDSIAMPLIGAGTGGGNKDDIQTTLEEESEKSPFLGQIIIVHRS